MNGSILAFWAGAFFTIGLLVIDLEHDGEANWLGYYFVVQEGQSDG